MVITLSNGESITIYENYNLLKQLEPYIDKEIYELLNKECSFLNNSISCENFELVAHGEDLEGATIKYCNLNNGCDLDEIIIATHEGYIMIADIDDGSDYSCPSAYCYNEKRFKSKIVNNKHFREELLNNKIITKEYIEQLLKEDEIRQKKLEEKIKKEEYETFLKLKEKFEGKTNRKEV